MFLVDYITSILTAFTNLILTYWGSLVTNVNWKKAWLLPINFVCPTKLKKFIIRSFIRSTLLTLLLLNILILMILAPSVVLLRKQLPIYFVNVM